MRQGRRGRSRRSAPSTNRLGFERLEHRLPLSHDPLPTPTDSLGFQTVASATFFAAEVHVENAPVASFASFPGVGGLERHPSASPSAITRDDIYAPAPAADNDVASSPLVIEPLYVPAEIRVVPVVVVIVERTVLAPDFSALQAQVHSVAADHYQSPDRPDVPAGDSTGAAAAKLPPAQHAIVPGLTITPLNTPASVPAAEILHEHGAAVAAATPSISAVAIQRQSAVTQADSAATPPAGILLPPSAASSIARSEALGLSSEAAPTPSEGAPAGNDMDSPGYAAASDAQSESLSAAAPSTTLAAAQVPASSIVERPTLLADVGFGMQAVDRAIDAALVELEELGGDLITWLDDYAPSWTTTAGAATALAAGGAYVLRSRTRRSVDKDDEEVSSTWLFTRFQSPAGQP
jgi:hypothetical protein